MCYTTPAQPKSLPTKLFDATLIQPDFFKLSENCFRGLHLHNLESLRRYHFTLHSYNLTFTTLLQFDFRAPHLYILKSLSTIRFCTLHLHNLTFTTFVQLDFRVLYLHNLSSLSLWLNDIFHATLPHRNFYYIPKNMILSYILKRGTTSNEW